MSQAENRLRERHGEDAVDRAKSSIALKVKGNQKLSSTSVVRGLVSVQTLGA